MLVGVALAMLCVSALNITKTLVVLDNKNLHGTHSEFFKQLESYGTVEYAYSFDREIKLKYYDEYIYERLIIMCTSHKGTSPLTQKHRGSRSPTSSRSSTAGAASWSSRISTPPVLSVSCSTVSAWRWTTWAPNSKTTSTTSRVNPPPSSPRTSPTSTPSSPRSSPTISWPIVAPASNYHTMRTTSSLRWSRANQRLTVDRSRRKLRIGWGVRLCWWRRCRG